MKIITKKFYNDKNPLQAALDNLGVKLDCTVERKLCDAAFTCYVYKCWDKNGVYGNVYVKYHEENTNFKKRTVVDQEGESVEVQPYIPSHVHASFSSKVKEGGPHFSDEDMSDWYKIN